MTSVATAQLEGAVPEEVPAAPGMFRRLALRRQSAAVEPDAVTPAERPAQASPVDAPTAAVAAAVPAAGTSERPAAPGGPVSPVVLAQRTSGGLPVRGHAVAPATPLEGSQASLTGVELYQALTGQDWLASSDEPTAPWSAGTRPAAAAPALPAPAPAPPAAPVIPQQAPPRPAWLPTSALPTGLPLWSQGLQQPRTLDPRSVQAPPPPPSAPVTPSLPTVQAGSATVAVPALSSNVRPALILKEQAARDLLAAAKAHDVGRGGVFAAGPAGVQVWSQPFDGPGGTHGSSVHLGSIDWIYDTPAKNYATIYRAMTTSQGISVGHTPETILAAVLALTGLSAEGSHLTMPAPPPRDPFRRRLG